MTSLIMGRKMDELETATLELYTFYRGRILSSLYIMNAWYHAAW